MMLTDKEKGVIEAVFEELSATMTKAGGCPQLMVGITETSGIAFPLPSEIDITLAIAVQLMQRLGKVTDVPIGMFVSETWYVVRDKKPDFTKLKVREEEDRQDSLFALIYKFQTDEMYGLLADIVRDPSGKPFTMEKRWIESGDIMATQPPEKLH